MFFDSFKLNDAGEADEFTFYFDVGDADTGTLIGPEQQWGRGSRGLGPLTFPVDRAPDTLGVQVYVDAQDSDFLTLPSLFLRDSDIQAEGFSWTSEGDDSLTRVTRYFDLTGADEPPQEIPFTLEPPVGSPNGFTVFGRLRMEAQSAAVIQPPVTKSAQVRMPVVGAATLAETGGRVLLRQGRESHVVQLVDHALYCASAKDAVAHTLGWRRIATGITGPVTAALSGNRLHGIVNLGRN